MAAVRTKMPVGSAPWIVSERRQANELIAQEVEEFGYSVKNEMEWLNEHMGEIFSANNLNVADIFKTPGKLRGKTPRTARKRNALGQRAPLTDIFAPNPQASPSPTKTQFYKQVAQFQVAEDNARNETQPTSTTNPSTHYVPRGKENTDSGYHGITDDEMDIDGPITGTFSQSPGKNLQTSTSPPPQPDLTPAAEERRATEDSFVSAKENLASRKVSQEDLHDDDDVSTVPDENLPEAVEQTNNKVQLDRQQERPELVATLEPSENTTQSAQESVDDVLDRMDEDDVRSPSDSSSPVKPLLRKSSLTFSSLPAREPLAQKKSIGARTSRTSHVDQFRAMAAGRSSQLGRFTGGKSLGGQQHTVTSTTQDDAMDIDAADKPAFERQESETTKLHHQTTTQRLHDRINMLGQSRDGRPSKSVPLNSSTAQSIYPQLPQAQLDISERDDRPTSVQAESSKQAEPSAAHDDDDDDDDWIAPVAAAGAEKETLRPQLSKARFAENTEQDIPKADSSEPQHNLSNQQESPKRPWSPSRPKLHFGHKKAVSASTIVSPTHSITVPETSHQKVISVSNPMESTTPAGSPRKHLDTAVSATKAKLYSALRSAKGIFASSAGVSAQAKMEALSPAPRAKQQQPMNEYFNLADVAVPEPPLYPSLGGASRVTSSETTSTDAMTGRRTRSSSEREQKRREEEAKQKHKVAGELEKARDKERQKATAAANKLQKSPSKDRIGSQRPNAPSRAESEREKGTDVDSADEMPPPPPPKSMLPTTQSQRLREPRRIAKPTKDLPAKAKPAPVTVRMPSQRIGHMQGPSTSTLSQSLHDSLPPPPPPKQPSVASKPSASSLHGSSSTASLKGSGSGQAAKRALEAAAKKKEQEAKVAQRKAEQKRELEQRRAAKLDEERRRQEEERRKLEDERRRQEEERRAEQQRRAAEQQRKEETKRAAQRQAAETKRIEQQRLEQQRKEAQRAQAQHNDFTYAMHQEKAHAPPAHPRADLGNARPLSRMNLVHDPPRPVVQINPAKPPKRALQHDNEDEQPTRPGVQRNPPSYQQLDAKRRKTNEDGEEPMEPRRSVMAPPVRQSNVRKENKFPHGYAAAPAPAHHAASMFVKTVTAQHQLHHGKGGHPNDMAKYANVRIPFAEAPNPPAGPSTTVQHKTPGRPLPNSAAASTAKSSPHYPNGDSIALPEIATDSEDEDSDNEFQAPDWVNSPALRELLTQQQLVDPEKIFGPIAPLRMEEVFKNKDRHKKFRDRTSSANWSGNDRLTEEERQKDKEARERLMKDGGWTFQPGT